MYDSIFSLIQDLPPTKIDKLYGGVPAAGLTVAPTSNAGTSESAESQASWACKAVFQSLSSVSKNIVMRLLFSEGDINLQDLAIWIQGGQKLAILQSSFEELRRLHIVREIESSAIPSTSSEPTSLSSSPVLYRMNIYFKQSLKYAITHPDEPWHLGLAALQPDKKPPKISELDEFSNAKWENLLRTLVGAELLDDSQLRIHSDLSAVSSETHAKIREFTQSTVRHFLTATGLATEGPPVGSSRAAASTPSMLITAKGYEYMLQDRLSQVWAFVSAMLSRVRDAPNQEEEVLSLLFMLSFCQLGKSYPVASLSKIQRQVVDKLWLVGVIYLRNLKSSRFYPTRVAINLLSYRPSGGLGASVGSKRNTSSAGLATEDVVQASENFYREAAADDKTQFDDSDTTDTYQHKSLQLIVETNDQVVAYTSSDLDIAMLKLFVDIRLRLPNMVFGKITRDRVKTAYRSGIRSSQIINFLTSHAHPVVLERVISSQQAKSKSKSGADTSTGTSAPQSSFITDFEYTIVPNNVVDQLLLWEAESYRIQAQEAVVFMLAEVPGFGLTHYKRTVDYLMRLHCLLWGREATRMVAVTPEGVDLLQSFLHETLGL